MKRQSDKSKKKSADKMKFILPKPRYFIVVEEWNYPTESGREVVDDYDTKEQALDVAEQLCENEKTNYSKVTGCDPFVGGVYIGSDGGQKGYCITSANGLDDFWYHAKVIEVMHGLGN